MSSDESEEDPKVKIKAFIDKLKAVNHNSGEVSSLGSVNDL